MSYLSMLLLVVCLDCEGLFRDLIDQPFWECDLTLYESWQCHLQVRIRVAAETRNVLTALMHEVVWPLRFCLPPAKRSDRREVGSGLRMIRRRKALKAEQP